MVTMSRPPSPAQVGDELERAVAEERDADALVLRVLDVVGRRVPFDGACWHLHDPETGAWSRIGARGDLPGTFDLAMELELYTDDVLKFADLGRRTRPAGALSLATRGRLERSPRYQEMIGPDGHGDELRWAWADPFGVWGTVALHRGRERPFFRTQDVSLLDRLSPVVAAGLRRLHARASPAPGTLGVAVLGEDARLTTADAVALGLLDALREAPGLGAGPVPAVVHVLAARARAGEPAHGAVRTADGALLALDASRLADGQVALVLRPAAAGHGRAAALGLTPRERQVLELVRAGRSAAEIAAELVLSPHTVNDHLKAIYAKAGVRSRRELVASL